ncbi:MULTISPECIES: c-type cytochrome biogenesis protein CcsB [Prauserella salsuginis group]|uniref:C-type cytochrome biogenesis protein CcsB n=1 Tax=Prauserella salsuginis TaxID=387889 RepID=A0ABW6G220_9PSEU|nr:MULTISPECIES: c-type cytochrome biogenesis protein CcsB [Prauserella salsuginis group]MCR3719997.1 cytochrome c-type biogenesis protein CcsB [Prauserella flava]MCR3736459.1 cytochrome c-type biogenesis protein CcsB [Prauserella salsuginis]
MPVNETLSQYSDWSYTTSVVIYILAMVFFLVEQSFGRRGKQAAERTRSRELVGARAGNSYTASGSDNTTSGTDNTGAAPTRAERFGRMGVALTVLGLLLHASALVLRGLATNRVPWGNMYEYVMITCFVAVAAWLVLLRKHPVRHLSMFVLLPNVILMFIGGTWLYAVAAPLQPALQSYWLIIHVAAAAASSGVFLVPGVASIFYLVKARNESNPEKFAKFAAKLPAKDVLDRIAYRTTVFAFPIFTFGVLCGAVWAEAAWGRFWGWDPKETVAFIAWIVYAAYLHSRATAGWRGNRAAVINVIGFAVTVFNLFFVNLVTTGLHSYAGVG